MFWLLALAAALAAPCPPAEASLRSQGFAWPVDDLAGAQAGGDDTAVDPALAAQLDAVLADRLARTEATLVDAALWSPAHGAWAGRAGLETEAPLWWASVGKLVTATLVLQLVEEGRVGLHDPLARWEPRLRGARSVTVDDLLRHTSGLHSFNDDLLFQQRGGYHAPAALLARSASRPLAFCPGAGLAYSNTNYLALARIVEAERGVPFAEAVQTWVAAPAGATSLRVVAPDDPPSSLAPTAADRPFGAPEIATVHGAGGLVATAPDMLRFGRAWFDGTLLRPETQALALSALLPLFGDPALRYGRGVMVLEVPDPGRRTVWVGHLGGAPAAKAVLVYDVDRNALIAVALNREAPAEALALDLLRVLDAAP